MTGIDLNTSAELFVCRNARARSGAVHYRRFATCAEAIRYAVETIAQSMRAGVVIECEEVRLDSARIREIYDSAAYPLPRNVESEAPSPAGRHTSGKAGRLDGRSA